MICFNNITNILHCGDLLAVPFFLLAIYYFYIKKNRTVIENILLLFVSIAFIFDLYFSYLFLTKSK
jgi:hypothetical protein